MIDLLAKAMAKRKALPPVPGVMEGYRVEMVATIGGRLVAMTTNGTRVALYWLDGEVWSILCGADLLYSVEEHAPEKLRGNPPILWVVPRPEH